MASESTVDMDLNPSLIVSSAPDGVKTAVLPGSNAGLTRHTESRNEHPAIGRQPLQKARCQPEESRCLRGGSLLPVGLARAGVTALGLCALGGVSESLFELSNITSVWYVNASSRFLLIYLVTIPTERFHYQITTRPVSYATVSRQACVYRLAR